MTVRVSALTCLLVVGCASTPPPPEQNRTEKFTACSAGEEAVPLMVYHMRPVPTELLGKTITVRFNLKPDTARPEKLEVVSGSSELLPYLDGFEHYSVFKTQKAKCIIGEFGVTAR